MGVDDVTLRAEAGGAAQLVTKLRERRLTCTDVGVLLIGSGDTIACAERLAGIAAATDAGLCIAAFNAPPTAETLAELELSAGILAEAGARLAVEFVAYTGLPTLDDAVGACAHAGWERCGVLVDKWHFFRGQRPWELLRSLGGDQVALVHVNDGPLLPGDDPIYESRFGRLPPGAGTFPIAEFAGALTTIGYDGVVSLEILSADVRSRPPAEGALELMRSLRDVWP